MRKLSAVAIGGSNTVMRPGYLTELPRCLERHGISLDLKANLAVGNTTILNGLINLKSKEDVLKVSDVLLIEYTLNDTSAFAGSLESVSKWVKGMEGAIRFARTVNPSIKVIPIIFATRTGVHRSTINPLHGGVHYLANYYGLVAVDVNAAMMVRFGRDFFEAPGAYGDYAHYQRPVFTTLAAEIIADKVKDSLLSRTTPPALPPPVDPENYGDAGLIASSSVDGLKEDRFKNYLYDETTFDLGSGSLEIEIEGGTLLAAKFACTDDISQCYAKVNNCWYQARTLQPGMEEPKYKFLLSMISFDGLPQPKPGTRILLTGAKPNVEDIRELPQHGARKPVRDEVRLPICAILHTGKLKGLRTVVAQEDEILRA